MYLFIYYSFVQRLGTVFVGHNVDYFALLKYTYMSDMEIKLRPSKFILKDNLIFKMYKELETIKLQI